MSKVVDNIDNYLGKVNEKVDKDDVIALENAFKINMKKKKDEFVGIIKPKNNYDFFYIAGMMKDITKKLGYTDVELGRTENTFSYKKGPFTLLVIEITKKNEFVIRYHQSE